MSTQTVLHLALLGQPGSMPLLVSPRAQFLDRFCALSIQQIESFVPLLASLGVSQNMPLSRVICVTHYTGFPFGSASFTELLCWYGTVLSALPQFTCRNSVDLCRPWLGVKRFVPLLVANS